MVIRWNKYFALEEQPVSIRREIGAGITTFLTMAYIIFVQPAVLSGSLLGSQTGMDFGAVTAATCLSAAVATLLMGIMARYPIALAPGMGENFFFVTTAIPTAAALGFEEPWRVALGVVFISGLLFLCISLGGVRRYLLESLSPSMKNGIAVGIGLFIAFIGLRSAAVVVPSNSGGLQLNARLFGPDQLIFFATLVAIVALQARGFRGAILVGILFGTALTCLARLMVEALPALSQLPWIKESMLMGRFEWAKGFVSAPPSLRMTFAKMDLLSALNWKLLPLILVFLFMDLFDTMGTLIGVAEQAGFIKDGKLPRAEKAFMADAIGTIVGALLGTSTVTSYIESLSGVEQGGRTGLVAVTVAFLFLIALFFSPIISMIASYPPITAPAVVMVGVMMMRNVVKIDWQDPTEAVPAFAAMLGIPLTYSISDGLALALLGYPIAKGLSGRAKDVPWTLYIVAGLLVLYFAILRPQVG